MSNYTIKPTNPDIKIRPCLRCNKMTKTTTSYRLCKPCRDFATNEDTYESEDYRILYNERRSVKND